MFLRQLHFLLQRIIFQLWQVWYLLFLPRKLLFPLDLMKRHTFIIGDSGSGKSELIKFLFWSLYTSKVGRFSSFILLDPHGDLALALAKLKHLDEKRLAYIQPTLFFDEFPGMNMFYLPSKHRTIENVGRLAENLSQAFEEMLSGNASLTTNMRALFIPCASVCITNGLGMMEFQRFMNKDVEQCKDLIALGKKSSFAVHADFFRTQFESSYYDITKSSLYTKIQSLRNNPVFERFTGSGSTFDLEELVNSGRIILFNLSFEEKTSEAIGRLIMARLKYIALKRAKVPEKFRKPIWCFIDESHRYTGASIRTILEEARKYGLHMILANQHFAQMSSALKSVLLSCTAVKITGTNSADIHQVMSREAGIKRQELQKLKQWQFYLHPKGIRPRKYKTPPYLVGDLRQISDEEWKEQLKEQKKLYYRKPSQPKRRTAKYPIK